MKQRLNIIIIIIISLYVLIDNGTAYESPPLPKDGLTLLWHPGGYCIPCHYVLTSKEKAMNISSRCNSCHKFRPEGEYRAYKIDSTKIVELHKNVICIRCHVGIKNGDIKDNRINISFEDFHSVHSRKECIDCHQYPDGKIQIPDKKNCADCHDGNPHVVHGKEVERLCIACHGEKFAKNFIGKEINISAQGNITIGTTVPKEYPTITKVFGRILNIII